MNAETKFITDASLAGLAKWLRLLGFDTIIYGSEAGRPMIRLATSQERILLTRRRDIMERQFSGRLYLVPATSVGKQLHYVISKISLKINSGKIYTLCLECNEKLFSVEKEEVPDLVPQFIFEHCNQYNQCPKCRKIYWSGTHGRNAFSFLEKNNITINIDEGM